jgi:sulfur relay (sulfurtransferase) complex TusBCD TusD component (DsrE family)
MSPQNMTTQNLSFKKWLCLITDSPYLHPKLNRRLQQIDHIARQSEELILFFYLDGIHQLNSEQYPKNFANIGKFYRNLHDQYPKIEFMACSRCTAARGYIDLTNSNFEQKEFFSQKLIPFIQIVSIHKFGDLIAQNYQVLQI